MAPDHTPIQITVRCHCRQHSFSATAPSLPLRATCCHCTSCRRLTGSLYSLDTPWPGPPEPIFSSSLKRFAFSPRIVVLSCGTCSSLLFWVSQGEPGAEPSVGFFSGTFSTSDDDHASSGRKVLVRVDHHIFVADTVDGGSLRRFPFAPTSTPTPACPNEDWSLATCWMGGRDKSQHVPGDWPAAGAETATISSRQIQGQEPAQQIVPIACKCRGVELTLYATDKLPASVCSCRACRATAGVGMMAWASTALQNIGFPVGTPSGGLSYFPRTTGELRTAVFAGDDLDARMGTLAAYESSPGAQRYYCARCSACVFRALDAKPGEVNVAVGLLDVAGARAEGLLSWADCVWTCEEAEEGLGG